MNPLRRLNHRRIDFFRALKLAVIKFFFDHQRNVLKITDSKKILVLRLDDKLGDGVVSTGFLKTIKEKFPDFQLTVLTGGPTVDLYRSLPFVDQVKVLNKGLFSSLRSYADLKRYHYQWIINTSHILNPRVIFHMSRLKSPNKLGFLNKSYRLFTSHVAYDGQRDHATLRYAGALRIMGVTDPKLDYFLPAAAPAMKTLPKDKKIIVLNSFAGARLRNFSEDTTVAIVKGLLTDENVFIVSVANEGDHRILTQWQSRFTHSRWVHFPEASTLADNFSLVAAAHTVITPDTAWVHIASAYKKNLVAVYRKDGLEKNSLIWAPKGTVSTVIYSASEEDINQIDTGIVVQAVLSGK